MRLQFVDELAELAIGGAGFLDRDQTVEHQDGSLVGTHLPTQQIHHAFEAVLFEHSEGADVVNEFGNHAPIVKAHVLQMLEHARMILGQQRHEQRSLSLASVMETDLVGENGLTCARRAAHDVHGAFEKAALEDLVQSGHARCDSLQPQLLTEFFVVHVTVSPY